MRYYWISNKLFKIPSELRINVEFMQQSNGALAADWQDLNGNLKFHNNSCFVTLLPHKLFYMYLKIGFLLPSSNHHKESLWKKKDNQFPSLFVDEKIYWIYYYYRWIRAVLKFLSWIQHLKVFLLMIKKIVDLDNLQTVNYKFIRMKEWFTYCILPSWQTQGRWLEQNTFYINFMKYKDK